MDNFELRRGIDLAVECFENTEAAFRAARELLLFAYEWKYENGSRSPRPALGLLQISQPFEQAKPYYCHEAASGYFGLISALARDGYPKAQEVKEEIGWRQLLPASILAEYIDEPMNESEFKNCTDLFVQCELTARKTERNVYRKEATKGTERQRFNASRRRANPLSTLIYSICESKPAITHTELLLELRNHVGKGIVDEILEDEGLIYFIDKNGKGGEKATITGLKDRLSRAKERLRNSKYSR